MKIIIDGREIEAEGKRTVLEVARENGFYIPSLCDHQQLIPFAGCRLCLVEIKGRKGYLPSCSNYIEDGMEVKTDSLRLRKLRSQILELILTEHPNACLICKEKEHCDDYKSTIRKVGETTGCVLCSYNGRCELQNVVEAVGIEKVNNPSVYRDIEIKKGDPFFDRNYNLCILCGRCVRICQEVRGASTLTFISRGSEEVVGTALDKPLIEAGCQFCGACVDVCPTGSLVERSLRYETLPDDKTKTVCALCGIGCELEVELRKGRIISTRPFSDGVVNKGQACVKGRFTVKDIVNSPKRILHPLIRREKELEEVSWEEALDFLGKRLKKYRGRNVAMIASPQVSCEDNFVFQKFAKEVFKTDNICNMAEFSPLDAYYRFAQENGFEPQLNFEIEEILQAKAIFLVGTELNFTHPIIWLAVLRAIRNGAKLIVASPVDLFLNRYSSVWLQYKPGSEHYLFSFLSKIVLEDEQVSDLSGIEGLDSFKKDLAQLSLTQANEITGVSEEVLEKTSQALRGEGPSVFLFGMELTHTPQAKLNLAAFWNLALHTQSRLIPLGLENNQRGLFELNRNSSPRQKDLNEIMKAVEEGQIKAIYQTGPIPYPKKAKAEFLIVQDCFMGENCAKADVVLPAATFVETEGSFVNVEGRIQKFDRVIHPLGEAKPDWWIISRLAQKMGHREFDYKKPAEIMKEIRTVVPGLVKTTFIREEEKGEKKFVSINSRSIAEGTSKKDPFLLSVDYSLDYYRNLALGQEIRGLGLIRNNRWVKIHPDDASRLDLEEGDSVEVVSGAGKLEGVIRLSELIPKGMVTASFLWSDESRFSTAALLSFLSPEKRFLRLLPVKVRRGK